jgi:hypothetical protein
LAATGSVVALEPAAGAGVEDVLELVVGVLVAVLAGAGLAELVLLEELPQPARASRATARAGIASFGRERVPARPAV